MSRSQPARTGLGLHASTGASFGEPPSAGATGAEIEFEPAALSSGIELPQ